MNRSERIGKSENEKQAVLNERSEKEMRHTAKATAKSNSFENLAKNLIHFQIPNV